MKKQVKSSNQERFKRLLEIVTLETLAELPKERTLEDVVVEKLKKTITHQKSKQ